MNCVEDHLDGKNGAIYVGSLDAANDIELLRKHNVLPTDIKGISRSSTMVIAYLMKTKGWKCEKESYTLAQSNTRTTQSLVKKVEALIDRTSELRPMMMRGSQLNEKKKIAEDRPLKFEPGDKQKQQEPNAKELQISSIRDSNAKESKLHVKPASYLRNPNLIIISYAIVTTSLSRRLSSVASILVVWVTRAG
ncbi:unnamed protein product [Sphagnum balticum]